MVLSNDGLNKPPGGSTGPHSVGDGTRQDSKVGEVGVDVNPASQATLQVSPSVQPRLPSNYKTHGL